MDDKFEDKVNRNVAAWRAERGLNKSPLDIPPGAHSKGLTLMSEDTAKAIIGKKAKEIRNIRKTSRQQPEAVFNR
jgi:hypothetical protein